MRSALSTVDSETCFLVKDILSHVSTNFLAFPFFRLIGLLRCLLNNTHLQPIHSDHTTARTFCFALLGLVLVPAFSHYAAQTTSTTSRTFETGAARRGAELAMGRSAQGFFFFLVIEVFGRRPGDLLFLRGVVCYDGRRRRRPRASLATAIGLLGFAFATGLVPWSGRRDVIGGSEGVLRQLGLGD